MNPFKRAGSFAHRLLLVHTLIAILAATTFSCGSDAPEPPRELTLKAPSDISTCSDVTKKAFGLVSTTNAGADEVPDIYVIRGEDIENTPSPLSNSDFEAIAETLLAGNMVIVDKPTNAQLAALCIAEGLVLGDDDFISETAYKYDNSNTDGLATLLSNVISDAGDHGDEIEGFLASTSYEAVGVRRSQIYYIHKFDDLFASTSEIPETFQLDANETPKSKLQDVSKPDIPEEDLKALTESAAAKFAEWINGARNEERVLPKDGELQLSLLEKGSLDDIIAANTFYHSFTAYSNDKYKDRKENVELMNEVWAGCDIANQKDYYLVHTHVAANNNQLGFQDNWGSNKRVGPYFHRLEVKQSIDTSKQNIRNISPTTATGSTTFSSTSGWNIGGNVGITAKGPSAGISGGYTCSKTSMSSIPDIRVEMSKPDSRVNWKFEAPSVDWGWHGLYTYCDCPKGIQYKRADFDTYAVYELPSDYNYGKDTVELSTHAVVEIRHNNGWLSGFLNSTLNMEVWKKSSSYTFYDRVPKPCNKMENFIMAFDAPSGTDADTITKQNDVLKEYFKTWNSNVDYWAVQTTDSPNGMKEVAESTFTNTMNLFKSNKEVLKGRGFSGQYTFYIKKTSDSDKLKTETIAF